MPALPPKVSPNQEPGAVVDGRPYRYAATLSWGGDTPTAELEIECAYSVAWNETDCDEVEDIQILTVDGKPWPVDLSYAFQTEAEDHDMLVEKLLGDHEDWMIREAMERDAERHAEAADRRNEILSTGMPRAMDAAVAALRGG